MQYINQINAAPFQQYNLLGDAGQVIIFQLRYLPTQQSWMFSLSYDTFVLNGVMLTVSLNALRSYKNIINFGLAVASDDGYEPQNLTDFLTGRIKIYLLNQAEVDSIESEFYS